MGEAEYWARQIARALHADLEPDDRVSPAGPKHRAGFFVVPKTEHTIALWEMYAPAGEAIAAEVEMRIESVHQVYVDEAKERE